MTPNSAAESSSITRPILIMAGGTGGHIMPGLAVARQLQAKGARIEWLGSRGGLEQKLVATAQIPLHTIAISGVRGKGVAGLLLAPFRLIKAIYQAYRLLKTLKPQVVIGFGGFVSAPGGVAAWLLRYPLVIQEQNAVAGWANRLLSRLAKRVFQAFPQTFPQTVHPITCGNPIRETILGLPTPWERYSKRTDTLRVLVMGGSQGAHIFNTLLPEALALLQPEQRPQVCHATGHGHQSETQSAYQQHGITGVELVEFINDMASAYAWADLVICRSGALTVSELAVAGVASLLIPYPYAVDDHQTKNAQWLVDAQAATVLPQSQLTAASLAHALQTLGHRQTLLEMAEAAYRQAKRQATQTIASGAESLIRSELIL